MAQDYKPLQQLVNSSLNAFGRRGIVKPSYIEELLRQHETSHATYFGTMIWVMMMLERWLKKESSAIVFAPLPRRVHGKNILPRSAAAQRKDFL